MDNTITLQADGDTITIRASQPLALGSKLSSGVSGLLAYGVNIHSWQWEWGNVGPLIKRLGSKAMRISTGPQATVDAALNDGMQTVLINAGQGNTALAASLAQMNAKWGERVVIENGNEYVPGQWTQYAASQKAFAQAAWAVNPNARIAAFQTNHNYTSDRINERKALLAQADFRASFNSVTLHAYYQRPEQCWLSELLPFIGDVADACIVNGKSVPDIHLGEFGWSNATNAVAAFSGENFTPNTGATNVQTTEWAANYLSRLLPIVRATPRLRTCTVYALHDEGPVDRELVNVEAHFGLFGGDADGNPWKPAGYVAKDLFARLHAATDSTMYRRSGDLYSGDYFVRNTVGASSELICWNPTVARSATVVVDAPAGGTLSYAPAGDLAKGIAPKTFALTPGRNPVSLPLGVRSLMVWADKPISFPEFMS